MVNAKKSLQGHGFEQKLQLAKAGAEQYLPQTSVLELSGKETTVAQVVADFAAVLAKYADIRSAKAALAQKRVLLHDALQESHTEYVAFKSYLEAKLGKGNPQLSEFGFSLGEQKPRSSETNVLAKIKAQQTRKVRHTLGRKQKLALGVTGPSALVGPDGKAVSVEETAPATPTVPAASSTSDTGQGASPKPV
jgi:hypothetical protein